MKTIASYTAKSGATADSDGLSLRPGDRFSAEQARELLVQGNRRFVSGQTTPKDLGAARRRELAHQEQRPHSVVLSCSDSRVPPELIFDQALGDLFVVRVAGNVVGPAVLGSVEFAVEYLYVPLVVVLGHENCGAVTAAVEGEEVCGSIGSILGKLQPSVAGARATGLTGKDLCEAAEDENIRATVAELRQSPAIRRLAENHKLAVLGAKYHMESGEVRFFPE